jgi:parallel beta-helix repeat protein
MKSINSEHSASRLKKQLCLKIQKLKWHELFCIAGIFLYTIFSSLPLTAQPSGGPYGPIQQTYELPKDAQKIYYAAPDGNAQESGESLGNPTTLEAAIERVETGDAIILRGGTYRTGDLILNQGITIQPYADEQPVLKGTYIATEWKEHRNGLWTTSWAHLFPSRPAHWWRRQRHGKETPLHRFNNDMVFIDGKFLQAVGWEGEVDEDTYYIDYENGLVYIGVDPADRLVEITAFDIAIHRITGECHGKTPDNKGPVIRGITFTQYAYRAIEVEGTEPEGLSDEAYHGKEVIGTTLEHCTISFCSRVAASLRGDKLTIRHCKVSDTSTEGLYIIASCDVLLEKNIFTRNNIERITGYYPAAVKIFNQSYRVTCRDNLVIDLPYSNGIWYDVGNVDGIFINNWVEGVGTTARIFSKERQWPSESGFFFEISKGVICAGNVFVNCDQGIFVLNSSDAQIYHNTFVNSTASIGRTPRIAEGDHFGWHASTGPDVDERDGHVFVNNLLTGDENFSRPLLFVWQTRNLCERLDKPMMKQLDYSVFVRDTDKTSRPLIYWSPAMNENCQLSFESPEELNIQFPEFSANSKYFANYDGPLFRSRELHNYQLLEGFPGSKAASVLPDEIRRLLGYPKKGARFVGAYPICP